MVNETKNPQHLDCGRSIPATPPRMDSFYPPFVAGIDLPHQGVVDSYNPTAAAGDITERECVELHRQRAAQLVLSGAGNAYVVTEG